MSAVTTRRVDLEIQQPIENGIALNGWQARELANDTPELDCLLDDINDLEARGKLSGDEAERLRDRVWLLAELNGREGSFARVVAGNAQRIGRDVRPVEGRPSLKPAEVRRQLRPFLDVLVLGSDADPMAYSRAHGDLKRAVRQIPVETLLSPSLAKEVGRRKAELLRDLFAAPREEST